MTYESIYQDLLAKDKRLYTENGMLNMLERNRRIKERPQRFQEARDHHDFDHFDLILTCEEKCYDLVLADFEEKPSEHGQPVHVINMDVVDNPEDATIGAFLMCELVLALAASGDLDDEIVDIIQEYEEKAKRAILHSISFY